MIYTQFDEPVNALHEAILSQFGEEVTFSGIGLTATAVFKRYKDDVPGGGARPGVPRDELRVKQTDIDAHDIAQGTVVTVRGQAYKVISVERTKHGMTNLGIRRAH